MQNIYDNETFFESYLSLRENNEGLNDVLEIPAFRSLLPDLQDKVILDIGCGFGESSKWYAENGAKKVVGIDISQKMIHKAKEINADKKIEYYNLPMEEIEFGENEFDLVVSSLSFHYVEDFCSLIKKISNVLKPNGLCIFSQEHPVVTAKKINNGWAKSETGAKTHWILDNYQEETMRKQTWFVDGVIKYHRTIATIVNTLIENHLNIQKILEPISTSDAEIINPELKEERRRPPFIILKAMSVK
ncbi:class I SAM-dependent methyltransferase [Chengkuizengella axinellae]|uniref:Class I SAM-dependent methyltransferase n=1 Tax=Chengkuizengella axinellae TaxID=3064388 RepID=A0ABT9IVR8_9BACL|nr:class I SAM-dependent methyltransferase [Chengkuizengella sp. 2205SS18-9]MDP5272909.1 class I SAM-dependent methyltransferase [Chengkuizengella sp. 2205SS18-9]